MSQPKSQAAVHHYTHTQCVVASRSHHSVVRNIGTLARSDFINANTAQWIWKTSSRFSETPAQRSAGPSRSVESGTHSVGFCNSVCTLYLRNLFVFCTPITFPLSSLSEPYCRIFVLSTMAFRSDFTRRLFIETSCTQISKVQYFRLCKKNPKHCLQELNKHIVPTLVFDEYLLHY